MFTVLHIVMKACRAAVKLILLCQGGAVYLAAKKRRSLRGKQTKEAPMKNTTLIAIVAALAAAAGALAVAFCHLRRREAELEDFEDMLFGEDLEEEPCSCGCSDEGDVQPQPEA